MAGEKQLWLRRILGPRRNRLALAVLLLAFVQFFIFAFKHWWTFPASSLESVMGQTLSYLVFPAAIILMILFMPEMARQSAVQQQRMREPSKPDPFLQQRLEEVERRIRDQQEAKGGMGISVQEFHELSKEFRELRNAMAHSQIVQREISIEANVFATEAQGFDSVAKRWMGAVIIVGFVMAILAFLNYQFPPAIEDAKLVSFIAGRILLFSILTTLLVWAIANYRANYHNLVVNRHRANSLQLYVNVNAGLSQVQREDLLGEIVRSIVAPQTSGYAGADGSNAPAVSIIQHASDPLGKTQ